MFDINGAEFLILGGVALFVLGPDKLPGYAAQAARVLRQLRTMADGAKDQMREQLGPEFDDVDWKALDPRQYDPRRIVRDALSSSDDDAEPPRSGQSGQAANRDAPVKPQSPGGPTDRSASPSSPSTPGERAPYDEDAT